MKIAIDARILYTSTGRYVERLLEYLQQLDTQNEYVVLLLQKDFERWHPTGANFTKVVADFAPYTFGEQIGFRRLLNSLQLDLVHFTMPNGPASYGGRFVTTVHDLTLIDFVNARKTNLLKNFYKHTIKPAVFKRLIARTVHQATHLITPTDYVRQDIIKRFGVPESQITVTLEAADAFAADPEPVSPLKQEKFILAVGNAYPYKNLQRLIDATANVDGLVLALAGKPDYFYEQLDDYVVTKGYTHVRFLGHVSDGQLAWLYRHTALYAFPSLSEGFGLPGLEAMQYGAPVAAANATSLPEVYGDAAVYFDPENTERMAATLRQTLHDPKKIAELKAAGAKQVAKYSWKRTAEQTLEVYKNALK
jgi:glycosyltransferase involved in cell wall biosynthesis